jgi:hypothetical protein
MAIHLLKEETEQLIASGTQAILLESDITDKDNFHLAIRELQHADARNAAITAATQLGISNARVGMPAHPFPVDADGNTVVRPTEQDVDRYRVEIEITSKAI